MQIVLAKHIGFCNGVEHSIKLAENSLCSQKNNVRSLHPIIHNSHVVEKLKQKGLAVVSEEELKTGDTVIISAHGAPQKTIDRLTTNGINIIDATCQFVKSLHEKVSEYDQLGYKIIIFGDKNHAEIKATADYCKNYQIVTDYDEIDFSKEKCFFIITQTTFDVDKAQIIKEKIKFFNKNLKKTVVFFDSICYTTLWRQVEAKRIAKNAEIMLVIGDKTSANSLKLYDVCKNECAKTYFIENVSDLKSVQIENNNGILGIVSGASTPKELIMEVFYRMSEVNTTEQVVSEEIKGNATPVEEKQEIVEKKQATVSTMEEAMKQYPSAKSYREGMRLTTKVVNAAPTGIYVAIVGGGKNDCGFISKEEAEVDGTYDMNNYKPNDEIKCIIIPKDANAKSNEINLSKKAYDNAKLDDERVQRILAGEEFTLSSTQEVKGGLLGKIGTYTIFIPASQIRIGFVKNLADYTNKTLRLVALPPKEELDEEGNPKKQRNSKRIVASQRVILEKEKEEKDEEFWSKIYEGAIVNGKVKRFASFGAFVSLKYMDALVHCTDLSWSKKRVVDPSEILELNKNYDFIVLSADRENGKISLGYKQLQKKPYEIAQEKYPIDSVVTGKVARIVKFGAFVELEPGIDGLVHISQIKHGWIENAAEALTEGQEVKVKVLGYENDKITLSIKALLPEEPVEEVKEETTEAFDAPAARGKKDRNKKFKEVKDEDNTPREYVSGNHGVTLGDLFSNLSVSDDSTSND